MLKKSITSKARPEGKSYPTNKTVQLCLEAIRKHARFLKTSCKKLENAKPANAKPHLRKMRSRKMRRTEISHQQRKQNLQESLPRSRRKGVDVASYPHGSVHNARNTT